MLATQRSSLNFKKPNSFIPERFLGDPEFDLDKRHALQPFSLGPRNCLGRKYVLSLFVSFFMVKRLTRPE